MSETQYSIQAIPAVLTDEEVMKLLHCELSTLDNLVYSKALDTVRIGRKRRFRGTDVIGFLERRRSNRHVKKGAGQQANFGR